MYLPVREHKWLIGSGGYSYLTVVNGQIQGYARLQNGLCPILKIFKPFEQCDPESHILLDYLEFFPEFKSKTNVLNSLEWVSSKYLITVQIKGSSLWYKPHTIHITSRSAPNAMYREAGKSNRQYSIMTNRITVCIRKDEGAEAKSIDMAWWNYCEIYPMPPHRHRLRSCGGCFPPNGVVGLGVGRLWRV